MDGRTGKCAQLLAHLRTRARPSRTRTRRGPVRTEQDDAGRWALGMRVGVYTPFKPIRTSVHWPRDFEAAAFDIELCRRVHELCHAKMRLLSDRLPGTESLNFMKVVRLAGGGPISCTFIKDCLEQDFQISRWRCGRHVPCDP
eukprot:6209196-Pleurochrysis_carterae.AAC.2